MTYTVQPLTSPIRASVSIPGSKSYTNRALLMAAMSQKPVTITGALESDDTRAMIDCLRTLGVHINHDDGSLAVRSQLHSLPAKEYVLDADLSGITLRFLTALSCHLPGIQILTGKPGLCNRPIADLVDCLRSAGAEIEYLEKDGFPPLRVSSSTFDASKLSMKGAVSSQYFSAILMTAPLTSQHLALTVIGEQVSKPYIDMTIDTMARFGVTVDNDKYRKYTVKAGQTYQVETYSVEGDVSSASYFYAIAALTNSRITTRNINPTSKQADMEFLAILQKMGAHVDMLDDAIRVTGESLRPIDVSMGNCPDQAMTAAVLCAFANGTSIIRDIQSLRVKETERVVALQQELAKMGIKTEATEDTLTIHGGKPQAATIDTYGDHRMAMAFAVAGTKLSGVHIKNPEVVAKTYPAFWHDLEHVLAQPQSVILIGMRGSGKTSVGQRLAILLDMPFVDIDERIVASSGMSIPNIVEKHGWQYFRDLESHVIHEVCNQDPAVISTGGGSILRNENVHELHRAGLTVLLEAPLETLAKRIALDKNRPPLTQKASLHDELKQLWVERESLYRQAAQMSLNTDSGSVAEIAEQIAQAYKEYKL